MQALLLDHAFVSTIKSDLDIDVGKGARRSRGGGAASCRLPGACAARVRHHHLYLGWAGDFPRQAAVCLRGCLGSSVCTCAQAVCELLGAYRPAAPRLPRPPGGVLGLNFLRTFEIEVDVPRQQLVFHPAGHIARGYLDVAGMACITCEALKGGCQGAATGVAGPGFARAC